MKNKSYLFNFNKDIENKINFIIAKRALKKKCKPEKTSDLLRKLIEEEYERNK